MKTDNSFIIKPIGGVAEIGSNMTLLSSHQGHIIIDAGILFPREDVFNINYLIPDISGLPDTNVTLFITHGHEDHIGAIVHIVEKYRKIKIFAPRFAKELIRRKLHRQNLAANIIEYNSKTTLELYGFTLTPIQVNHSIPDTYGIVIQKNDYTVFFVSDFKYDELVEHEPVIEIHRVQTLFKKAKKTLCLLDSTNILNQERTLSEQELVEDLEFYIKKDQRVFITLFSSNVHRLKNIITCAIKHNKKIVTVGRSVKSYIDAAEYVKIISPQESKVVYDIDSINDLDSKKYVFLLTGCQGEHRGAVKRVVSGEYKLKLNQDDIIVFSSKTIPGNERNVSGILNRISEIGAQVITHRDAKVHASGHASQQDLQKVLLALEPDDFIPIHGESYFLRKHIAFVKQVLPKTKTHFVLNHNVIKLGEKIEIIKDEELLPPTLIHGDHLEIERTKISERRKLASMGLCIVSIASKTVRIHTRGLPSYIDKHIDKIQRLSRKTYQSKRDTEDVRIEVGRFIKSLIGYKPVVIVESH